MNVSGWMSVSRRSQRSCLTAGLVASLIAWLTLEPRLTADEPQAAEKAEDSCGELLGLMYWTKYDEGVYGACRDGSEVKLLVPMKGADGLAIDAQAGKLYVSCMGVGSIRRIKLDGTGDLERLAQTRSVSEAESPFADFLAYASGLSWFR